MNNDSSNDHRRLSRHVVADIYYELGPDVGRFLAGILRDTGWVEDALQATFATLMERGADVDTESLRSWVFRVAHNQAMLILRRQGISQRAEQRIAWEIKCWGSSLTGENSSQIAELSEEIDQVRQALQQIPADQRRVIQMRIYDGLKFAEIASELDVPLGTVLYRMQSGLKKLKSLMDTNSTSESSTHE